MHPPHDSQPSTVSDYDEVSCFWQFRSSPKKTVDVDPVAQFGFLLQDFCFVPCLVVVAVSSMFMWLITSLADVVEENIGDFPLQLVADPFYGLDFRRKGFEK